MTTKSPEIINAGVRLQETAHTFSKAHIFKPEVLVSSIKASLRDIGAPVEVTISKKPASAYGVHSPIIFGQGVNGTGAVEVFTRPINGVERIEVVMFQQPEPVFTR